MSFGYSAFELVKTIDNAATLIRKLKDSPKELDSIKKRVEFGQTFLASLREQIAEHALSVSDSERELLRNIYNDYDGALVELRVFINKNTTLDKLTQRLKWVVSEHFTNEREELSKTLKHVEIRINLMLQKLNWGASLKLLRSSSISVAEGERSPLSQQRLSPDVLLENQPYYLRNDSGQVVSESAAGASHASPDDLGIFPQPPETPYLPPDQPIDTDNLLDKYIFEQSEQGNLSQISSGVPASKPIPFTRSREPASFSGSPKDRTQALDGSPGTIYTATPSVFSAMSVSSQSEASTPRHSLTPTLSYQEMNSPKRAGSEFASSSSYGRSGSTPNLPNRSSMESHSRASSSASVSLSPGRNAPLRFEQELSLTNGMLQGVVKLWYMIGTERVSRTVIRINVEGEQAGLTRRLRLTTEDGKERLHEAGHRSLRLTNSFLQLHPECIEHITKTDPAARCVVSFYGNHVLTKQGEMRPFFTGSPEYAFTSEQDCWNFQQSVSCGKLLENVDVHEMECAANGFFSTWQVLQVWGLDGDRSIRFLEHYGNDHSVRILGLKTNTLYPIDLKKTKESELNLAFERGSENAEWGKMKIILSKELEKEKSKKARRKSGSKERPTLSEEESVRQRLIKLAQFGTR